MDSTFKTLLVVAIIMLASYTAYEVYNSIAGNNVEFREQVTEIQPNLGSDVIEATERRTNLMLYYPKVATQSGTTVENL